MWEFIISAIIYIFPAYVANAAAVVFGYGDPIDGGKKFSDGRPILGKGKTWRGLFAGTSVGTTAGIILFSFFPITDSVYLISFLLAFGALVGDLFFSFVKRRIGLERGQSFIPIDQIDFLIGAIALSAFIYLPTIETIIFLFVVTPIIHLITNYIGYLLGFKKQPY